MSGAALVIALLLAFWLLAAACCVFDHNTLVVGTTRYGKTYGVLSGEVFPAIDAGDTAVVVLDPHRTMGVEVASYALARGQGDRLVIDDLANYRRAASIGFVRKSRAETEIEREAEDLATARDFAEAACAQRGEAYGGIDGKPLIKEWLISLIMAAMSQTDGYDMRLLPWAFRPGTRQFEAFVAGIGRPALKAKFASLRRFNSEVALYNTVGPAARLVAELWMEPAFRERIRPTIDLEGSLENALIYVVLGGEEGTTTVLMRSLQLRLKNAVRTYYHSSGNRPLRVRVFADEVTTARLVGMAEARSLNSQLKMGLSWCLISHTPTFGDDEVDLLVDQGCSVKRIFHCTQKVAELVAGQLAANLDLARERGRTYRERDVFDGFEEYDRADHGDSYDEHGHRTGSNTRRGKGERARRKVIVDETVEYVSLHDQQILNEQALVTLPPRRYFLVDGGKVRGPLLTKEVVNLWMFDKLRDGAIAEHLAMQEREGISRPIRGPEPEPAAVEPEPKRTPPPPPKPQPPRPPQGKQNGGKSKRKGMK